MYNLNAIYHCARASFSALRDRIYTGVGFAISPNLSTQYHDLSLSLSNPSLSILDNTK